MQLLVIKRATNETLFWYKEVKSLKIKDGLLWVCMDEKENSFDKYSISSHRFFVLLNDIIVTI